MYEAKLYKSTTHLKLDVTEGSLRTGYNWTENNYQFIVLLV